MEAPLPLVVGEGEEGVMELPCPPVVVANMEYLLPPVVVATDQLPLQLTR